MCIMKVLNARYRQPRQWSTGQSYPYARTPIKRTYCSPNIFQSFRHDNIIIIIIEIIIPFSPFERETHIWYMGTSRHRGLWYTSVKNQ